MMSSTGAKQLNDLLVEHVMALEDEETRLRARIAALEAALRRIADAPAWGAPDRWETTPFEVRQLARAALAGSQDK